MYAWHDEILNNKYANTTADVDSSWCLLKIDAAALKNPLELSFLSTPVLKANWLGAWFFY